MLVRRRTFLLFAAVLIAVLASILLLERASPENRLYHGKTVRAWTEQLSAPTQTARDEALAEFHGMGGRAVPGLARLVNLREPVVRKRIWPYVAKLPNPVTRSLAPWLKPSNVFGLRLAALQALGEIGSDAQPAVPALAGLFRSGPTGLRYYAAIALGKIGGTATPVLLSALREKNVELRRSAAEALGEPGTPARTAMQPLMDALSDSNESVQHAASLSLGRRGPELLLELTQLMKSKDAKTRMTAARVLTFFRPVRAVAQPALVGLLSDSEPACRVQALRTLSTFSLPNRVLVETFCSSLKDAVPEVRVAAIQALACSPRMTVSSISDLDAALQDSSADVRAAAASALASFGLQASITLPHLQALEADESAEVRRAAEQAINKLELDASPEL